MNDTKFDKKLKSKLDPDLLKNPALFLYMVIMKLSFIGGVPKHGERLQQLELGEGSRQKKGCQKKSP